MVSSKERLRIEREFNVLMKHMEHQKRSIERLMSLTVVQGAALYEIAEGDMTRATQMRERARKGLEEAAAITRPKEESQETTPEEETNVS